MYIYHNKETDEISIFGSMKAIEDSLGIDYNTLLYHFSRLKKVDYYFNQNTERLSKRDVVKYNKKAIWTRQKKY